MAHQLGVGRLLAADHHGGHAAGDDGVNAVLPGPITTEQANHDDVGRRQQFLELTGDQPRRVRPPEVCSCRPRRDQVSIGRRQQ
jgi:hypothetical protein